MEKEIMYQVRKELNPFQTALDNEIKSHNLDNIFHKKQIRKLSNKIDNFLVTPFEFLLKKEMFYGQEDRFYLEYKKDQITTNNGRTILKGTNVNLSFKRESFYRFLDEDYCVKYDEKKLYPLKYLEDMFSIFLDKLIEKNN